MNFKTTLGLLIALVVLGTVAILVYNRPETPVTPKEQPKLIDWTAGDVNKVAVTGADKPIVIQRKDGSWRLAEPLDAPADSVAVESLVNGILNLRNGGNVDTGGTNAAAVGLDKPRYIVELTDKNGKSIRLKVGNRSAVGDRLYVQLEGQSQAAAVAGDVTEQLDKSYTAYRQTKLVTTPSSDIKQIQITRADGKISLQKNGNDWEVTAPEKMPAESSEVNEITNGISYLTAVEFANPGDVPPALLPEKNPKTTIWFSTAAPTTQPAATQPAGTTIRVGGYDSVMKKNVYLNVSNPPALATVTASSVDPFNKKPLDLRDRRVLDVDPATVSKVSITTDSPATTQPTTKPASKTTLVLSRKKEELSMGPAIPATQPSTKPTTGPATTQATTQPAATQPALPATNWTMDGPAKGDASQSRVDTLLGKFHALRVDKYLATSSATTQPAAQYTVEIDVVAAGAAKSGSYVIRLTDPGQEKPLVGQYNNLTFELPRTLLENLGGDYTNKVEPPPPPPMDMPPGRGMPPGMFGR